MIEILLFAICVESITEILVSSAIFFDFRLFVSKNSKFLGKLISCGYCSSVWVSLIVSSCTPQLLVNDVYIDYILKVFIYHRLSNLFHEFMSRYNKRLPFELVISNVNLESNQREAVEIDESK